MSNFDDIFKAVKKATKDDPLSTAHKAGDFTISFRSTAVEDLDVEVCLAILHDDGVFDINEF